MSFRTATFAAVFAALLVIYCDSNYTSPTDLPPNPPIVDQIPVTPTPPPRARLNTQFDWTLARGFTLFAGTRADEGQIVDLFFEFEREWPHLRKTARVCAEVQSWGGRAWLPRGVSAKPFDNTAPAFKELKNFLDVAVTIPDAQVLVVANCTTKEDGTSFNDMLKWTRHVCELTSRYPNTAVEVVNEAHHPNSSLRDTPRRVTELMRNCQQVATRFMEVGSDTNINQRRTQYEYNRAVATYLSYHPWRNPDPDQAELRAIVRDCIGCTVFSETTGLDVEHHTSGGLVTEDVEQIIDYARHAEKAGGVFVYHTVWGLGWPVLPTGYIIPRGDWEIRHGR
jgi:hypothetical protein